MNIGRACGIFKNINGDYSDEEKLEAIRLVIDMETHNGITKVNMLCALNWLWIYIMKLLKLLEK